MSGTRTAVSRGGTDGERGGATVVVAGVIASMLLVLVAVLALAQVQVARHVAQGAADLGSLAAAGAIQRGVSPVEACAESGRVVLANRAVTATCEVDGEEVVVTATVSAALGALGTVETRASARAGPVG